MENREQAGSVPEKNAAREAIGIASQNLSGARRELVILHAGQRDRLAITRQNKLILTK